MQLVPTSPLMHTLELCVDRLCFILHKIRTRYSSKCYDFGLKLVSQHYISIYYSGIMKLPNNETFFIFRDNMQNHDFTSL